MQPWCLGYSSEINPYYLQKALFAVVAARKRGALQLQSEKELACFYDCLSGQGLIESLADDNKVDIACKWRAALSQLGFIYPEIPAREGITQTDLGEPFTVTPNGRRLIDAETVPAMQECFLRSLAAYYIPSALERGYSFSVFSPLRHTLAIMLELERRTGESKLNFLEMGLFVQLTSSDNPLAEVTDRVLAFRTQREAAPNKRRFDQEALNAAATEHEYVAQTFKDYADTNFRYLKATGLVQSQGRGIAIVPEKRVFVEQLAAETRVPDSPRSFLIALCSGAILPTDNRDVALIVLEDLVAQVNRRGVPYTIVGRQLQAPADIAVLRHEIEDILAKLNEAEYAEQQAREWNEIAAYMDLLINPRRRRAANDDDPIAIPQAEAPAYFEWVLWRAFLAIDSLANRPYEARRFKVDQDFLPVGTAPGNGPDLIFEFEDFVVVVEVTLTESSRQEAAEGEPVRRHVAALAMQYEKPVYGLFIANKIDSNTAETFRIGVWYARDDSRMRLDIVPFTLAQFKALFESMFSSGNVAVATIRELLDTCSEARPNLHAPEWKMEIERAVQLKVANITGMC